jgi:hypothetical protein
MSSAPSREEIARDATWLAQALDPVGGQVRLVAVDSDSYRAASFLDDRLFEAAVDAQIVPWAEVEQAMADAWRQDARWIFHIGHVGSTLVSRLLGELDSVLAVREPRLLRDLALSPPEIRRRYAGPVPKLMSRTFAPAEFACVKATSFASEIVSDLVPAGERVLFMYATPGKYIGSILAGKNSVGELRMLVDHRASRLEARGIFLPVAHNDAERAAAAWACEMATLEAAADKMADRRVAWYDFDRALDDLAGELGRVAEHFGFAAEADALAALASGPLTRRYSKALDYAYSPALRRDLIAQATGDHRAEISEAIAMLERAAQESPLLARALLRSTEA